MNIISNVFGQENVTHLQLVDMYDKFQLIQLESALLNLGEDSGSSLKGGDSELKDYLPEIALVHVIREKILLAFVQEQN